MSSTNKLNTLAFSNAICYSGYRKGQDPTKGIYPSLEQVVEDLKLLEPHWQSIRIYDCGPHAELVFKAISQNNLTLKVMLGADLAAEENNPNCPWGANYSDEQLAQNCKVNEQEFRTMLGLVEQYSEHILALSIGNEASVDWNDHMVSVDRLIHFAQTIKAATTIPVTFCENYIPWTNKLAPLVDVLDFISIHTYPAWEYKTLRDALQYTKDNYWSVASRYTHKQVVITEAGWTTCSNNRGIERWNASEEIQAEYYRQLVDWSSNENILTFVFEAFDEPWKGSADQNEPEKHWGLFFENRQPKVVMQS